MRAQSVQVYSEFRRDPSGLPPAREIISPAVARNAFASFRVVISAPSGASYFLFVGANPPGIVRTEMFREDGAYLEEVRVPPGFGVIPAGQNTREYFLDVWVPAEAEPGRRVRVEVQLKTGTWLIYPMELRVQGATAPTMSRALVLTTEDLLQRNAHQDIALLMQARSPLPWLLLFRQSIPVWMDEGPEWVLRFRDLLYRSQRF